METRKTIAVTLTVEDLKVAVQNFLQAQGVLDAADDLKSSISILWNIGESRTDYDDQYSVQELRGANVTIDIPVETIEARAWRKAAEARAAEESIKPPAGSYVGEQTGYDVIFKAGSKTYSCQAAVGLRGINVKVPVIVCRDGVVVTSGRIASIVDEVVQRRD